jgi:hypothetical protein
MWWDILKKPYVIHGEIVNPGETDSEPYDMRFKFNKLFQGAQGKTSNLPENRRYEDSTLHWTPRLDEALCYAFFGSQVVPEQKSSYKNEAKPTIKQALKTDQDFSMRMDEGYANYKDTEDKIYWMFIDTRRNITPRGKEFPSKIDRRMPDTPKYKYLPDSKVAELGKQLLQRMKNNSLTSKDEENLRRSAGITEYEMEDAIKHLEMMLNKYF